jgi:hypothetical protein
MWMRATEEDRGDLAERVPARRELGWSSATELKSGDVVVCRDPGLCWSGAVTPFEVEADTGPQRLAAVAVIVPLLTALIIAAWLLLG